MSKVVAFVGNPNVGKSSWINVLSDSKFKVANYPGMTVEKKEAEVIWYQTKLLLVDLPGIYGFSEASNEELVTANFIREQPVDVIVNVVDATNLARNLNLTLLCRELQIPMLVLLNYKDEVEQQGIYIELEKLQQRLGIQMILCSARDVRMVEEIKQSIVALANEGMDGKDKKSKRISDDAHLCGSYRHRYLLDAQSERLLHKAMTFIASLQVSYQPLSEGQIALYALKWCEQDRFYVQRIQATKLDLTIGYDILTEIEESEFHLHRQTLRNQCMQYVHSYHNKRLLLTRQIDAVVLHPYLSMPIFFVVMMVMFCLVFVVSQPLTNWLDQFIHSYVTYFGLRGLRFLSPFLLLLIEKCLFAGIGAVLLFVPMLACLFFLLAVFEECGYFARVTFVFDRIMRPFGMSGKSFVALLFGFGCTVPAIYATRTIHSEKGKRITATILPLISCGARLPIYLLFSTAFFPNKTALVVFSLYGIGVLTSLGVAFLLHRLIQQDRSSFFMVELPPYRFPSLGYLFKKVYLELVSFVSKAFGVIGIAMVVLFLLSYFPHQRQEDSYLANAAKWVAPMFEPLGFGNRYEVIAALPGAVIAKENVIGYLGLILVSPKKETTLFRDFSYETKLQANLFGKAMIDTLLLRGTSASDSSLSAEISLLWTDHYRELRAYSYLVYVSLMVPCVMSLQALYRNYGGKQLLLSLLLMSIIPYVVSLGIFQIGGWLFD